MASCYGLPRGAWLSAAELAGHDAAEVAGASDASAVSASSVPATAPCLDAHAVAPGGSVTLYGRSVRRANLQGVDATNGMNSATSPTYRIKRSLLQARDVEEMLDIVERTLPEFDDFLCTLAVHRLARHAKALRPGAVLQRPQWPPLAARLREAILNGEPRHLASAAWALAHLAVRDATLLGPIGQRCAERTAGAWDPMGLSLVLQSFATLAAAQPSLADSISSQVQRELSAAWPPTDVARITWSFAKMLRRDDAFLRDASCKVLARMPEMNNTSLVQMVWAFATVAPTTVTSHFFPYAVEAMSKSGLDDYTAAHLAMIAWSFAAVLFRPIPLLEAIGDAVPARGEKLNSQDITMVAWAYAALLAPERRVFEFLAKATIRSVHNFNSQDLSNTVWAFATAGEHAADMFDVVADEACSRRRDFNGQHVAMLIWAFVTMRHRHDALFRVIGEIARVDQSSWHSAKLFAYALASLPKLQTHLGSEAGTLRVAAQLVEALEARAQRGEGEPDDAVTVHDAVYPWLDLVGQERGPLDEATWGRLDEVVACRREQLQGVLAAPPFQSIMAIDWWVYDEPVVREYQVSVQALGLRGLGSLHTWRLLRSWGVGTAAQRELAALAAKARAQDEGVAVAGRGERASFCFWRASVHVPCSRSGSAQHLEQLGRLQSSAVAGYREDNGGLVAVKLSHDHVSHRAWDAEFRAMARVAAASRALLAGSTQDRAQELLTTGAAAEAPGAAPRDSRERAALEARVVGRLEIYLTEVPCLSCACAMAQFRRRFPGVALDVAWDGMPSEGSQA